MKDIRIRFAPEFLIDYHKPPMKTPEGVQLWFFNIVLTMNDYGFRFFTCGTVQGRYNAGFSLVTPES